MVVVDEMGRNAISLVSGHLGGANRLAREVAAVTGGQPVITTATDVQGKLSFDELAEARRAGDRKLGQGQDFEHGCIGGAADWPV